MGVLTMNLFKEVLRKNSKMIVLYIVIGIFIHFLDLFSITYFQKILDSFQYGTLSIRTLIMYLLLLLLSTALGYMDNYPEQQVKNKLYLDFKLQALRKMTTIDYLEYQKIGTGILYQRIEEGASASRDIIVDFYLKILRLILPILLFSLIFIYGIQKELVLFIFIGYVLIILVSRILLKKLYKLKENILDNQELLNKRLIRGFMELVVFRTNKKYNLEIKIAEKEIKSIIDGKTRIKLVHELFFTLFEFIVNVLQVLILGYAVLTSNLTVGGIVQ